MKYFTRVVLDIAFKIDNIFFLKTIFDCWICSWDL